MSGEKTSLEEAGGVATGVTGRIGCWNADSEARLIKAMLEVGKWVASEAGVMLGHIKSAVTLDDGSGITLNLTDLSNGVEKHGELAPTDKVNFTFMSAVLDVNQHELYHKMVDAVDDSGLLYELDEVEHCHCHHHHDHGDDCHCHDHEHHHEHDHGKTVIVNNYYGDYYACCCKCCCDCCEDDDECCCEHEHHHHHEHDEECHCHEHEHHHHDHDHEHDECCCGHEHHHDHCCKSEHIHTKSGTVIVNNYYGDFHECKCKCCCDDDECCCEHEHHHHHDHDEECHCHEHEHHHHDHDHEHDECCCGHHHDD